MKSWSLPVITALLLSMTLTACGQQASTKPTSTPPASSSQAVTPTATPSPTPEVRYETLTLPTTPQPPSVYDGGFLTDQSTKRENAYTLVEALYTNNAEQLRSVLSDSILNDSLPLPDLAGLVVTDVSLWGGKYDVPYAVLTIADAGATGLPKGQHEFRFPLIRMAKSAIFPCLMVPYPMSERRVWGLNPAHG